MAYGTGGRWIGTRAASMGRWLVLSAAILGAGCPGGCDPDCKPEEEDCSLSPTCCTPPPEPLTLTCIPLVDPGGLRVKLIATVSGGTPPYAYGLSWGDGPEERGGGGSSPDGTFFYPEHAYPSPDTLTRTYPIRMTVTDRGSPAQSKTFELSYRADFPRLDIDCHVSPHEGQAPLTVTFEARKNDCFGECGVVWDFGDGATFNGDSAVHTYTGPGPSDVNAWSARGTLRDSGNRETTCHRSIQVLPPPGPPTSPPTPGPTPTPTPTPTPSPTPTPTPSPTPTPPPTNQPPVITAFTANPPTIMLGQTSQLTAMITDPDGDPVTWTLSLDAGSPPGTFTPGSGSGSLSSVFRPSNFGQAIVRVVASDGRGGTATATVTVTIAGGG